MNKPYRKKLIEVALPLEAINVASAREKSIRHGHPSTLHLWWARRPLAAARSVIFSQMVDDPSSVPELFPTEEAQEQERQRLFKLIEELVKWENTTNERVLSQAREEIWKSWRRACEDNKDHPRAKELFNPDKLPAFHDPFAGGGSLPLEAQRLGLEAHASDLNPVAVLINKAMIEIPPKFAGMPPVNPEAHRDKRLLEKQWHGAEGLAEDVRYYGKWMRDEAEKRIGHLYPKIEITAEMAKDRPDLKPLIGQKLTVIAWLWARTVKSPNPAFADVDVPLASTFMLSTKPGKEAYVEPLVSADKYRFTVKLGKPKDPTTAAHGTKVGRGGNFQCLLSHVPIPVDYIRDQGISGTLGHRLMAVVVAGETGRLYLEPGISDEAIASDAHPTWKPEQEINYNPRDIRTQLYGLMRYCDLFTRRQLVALTTFADLIQETRQRAKADWTNSTKTNQGLQLDQTAETFADAVALYLGIALSRLTNRSATLNFWDNKGENVQQVFARQALPMTWDYVEGNPFSDSTGNFLGQLDYLVNAVLALPQKGYGEVSYQDATTQSISRAKVISTDPPYYDNINYADLSDYFYVWLRRGLKPTFPELFRTLTVPKMDELVATPYRHGSREAADAFFLEGMTRAMHRMADQMHPAFPITIYYAFKQAERDEAQGTASTGWETFLDAVIRAGLSIAGTWPIRTEYTGNLKKNVSALASSIILVARPQSESAQAATRRDFLNALTAELPSAITHLQRSNIAPVDLAQAAIGPGMSVFTHYATVLDAAGKRVFVRDALALINQVLDEVLAEQEGDFDPDSRWALTWFEYSGFSEGEYGTAEILSKAKNTSVSGMVAAGIIASKGSRVRLLRPEDLATGWDPESDHRPTAWQMVHQLIRTLETGGERAAAELLSKLGGKAEVAREFAYRLYTICERKKRPQEAVSYNTLVQSWPEIVRLAQKTVTPAAEQAKLI